jgi:hypothetical protein
MHGLGGGRGKNEKLEGNQAAKLFILKVPALGKEEELKVCFRAILFIDGSS